MALIERDVELATIDAALDQGGVLVVEGGAGLGKTALLDEAVRRADALGHDIVRARGSALEADFAFGVVLQLFERRVATADESEREALLRGAAAATRPLLLSERLGDPALDTTFVVMHGLYWLAANLAERRSLVVVVDDVQWADAPSLRWLAYLARRLDDLAVTLVVGLRSGEPTMEDAAVQVLRAQGTVVRPGLLSHGAVEAMVRTRVGAGTTRGAVRDADGGVGRQSLLRQRAPPGGGAGRSGTRR